MGEELRMFITEQAGVACDLCGVSDRDRTSRDKLIARLERILSRCKTETEVERILRPLKFGEISLVKFLKKWEEEI